ncbi:hypothetical protein BDV93DRAFT_327649 [Ceratobasidium sp. AG-I]|nr:hypothetical protein BDV93DRAFT_327649 [Ceratobasidium sp. AG-I]
MNSSDPLGPSHPRIDLAFVRMVITSYVYPFLYNLITAAGLLLAAIAPLFLAAHFLGNVLRSAPTILTTQRAPVSPSRGKRKPVCNVPVPPAFAPMQFQRLSDPFFGWMMWLVDEVLAPAAQAITSARLPYIARKLQVVLSAQNLKAHVAPLRTRLKRGIAQVSTLHDALASRTTGLGIPCRYFGLVFSLFVLFVGLVFVVGTPVEIAASFCSGELVLVVAGDVGVSKPKENESDDKTGEDEVCDALLDAGVSVHDTTDLAPTAAL